MPAETSARSRPVLGGVVLAAGLLVVLMFWFGRACFGGWWVSCSATSEDTYMLGTLYESWAAQVKGGHLPLWFPEFGAGYPVHAAWMYGLFYPPLALFMVLPPEAAWTWLAILHIVFGALGMYAFLWDDRRDVFAAACGAVVFALSDFMLQRIVAGHVNLVMPMSWAPWVLLAAARTARGERGAAGWLGLCTGLGLLSGHAQVWFYVGPLVAAFAVMDTARRRAWKSAAPALAIGVVLALGIAAIQWIPALELHGLTGDPHERLDVVAACSVPASALASQIAPRFLPLPTGEFLRHEFVGLAGPLAVGAALLAFRLRDRRRWFWFAVLAFGVLLATGLRNPVGEFLNDLPPFRFARAPGRAMTIVVIAAAVLAGNLVADWTGALATWKRAALPVAFAASALFFGAPAPGSVRRDFYEYDWTTSLPAETKGRRIYERNSRYPYVERQGVRTVRRVCPVEPPGYAAITAGRTATDPGTPGSVSAWWLDLAGEFDLPPWPGQRPPSDVSATAALIDGAKFTPMTPGGRIQFFDEAMRVPDDQALPRLRAREIALFIPPDAPQGSWRTRDMDALRRVRAAPSTAPDTITLATDGPCSGVVFVSERWYPGWTVTPPSLVARGNLAFLAVDLECAAAGTVELRYRPWWLWPALAASGASLVAAVVIVVRGRGPR
jgi:hypothetical protein